MKKTAILLSAVVAILLTVVIVMTVGLVAVYKGNYTFKKTIVFEGFSNNESTSGSTQTGENPPKDLSEALLRAKNYNISISPDTDIIFELPINGSMGFTATSVPVYSSDNLKGSKITTLSAGEF